MKLPDCWMASSGAFDRRAVLSSLSAVLLLSIFTGASLWVFSSGFLSARLELPQRSSCGDLLTGSATGSDLDLDLLLHPSMPHTHHAAHAANAGSEDTRVACHARNQTKPHFDRVVMLIVDALRADFVFDAGRASGSGSGSSGGSPLQRPNEGNMPRVATLLQGAVSSLELHVG
eukprot:319010-Chlamydomonas_euryale.AAC.3